MINKQRLLAICNGLSEQVSERVPETLKQTAFLRYFAWSQIPLLAFVNPKVESSDDEQCVISIALNRRTKNHLNSMYFATLCAGADVAAGWTAMKVIHDSRRKVSLSFKQFQAEFFKRAEGNTYFENKQGLEIRDFVNKVIESGERMSMPVHVTATVPDKFGSEPVAQFTLELSLKLTK